MSSDQDNQIKNLEFDLYEMKRKYESAVQETEERENQIGRLKTKIGQLNK